MARHEVKIHANGSRTAESAPFLGSYITKSTVGLDAVSAMAAELVGMPTLKYKNTLQNAIETFLDWEREGACRIYVDGGYIEIKLLGSFPASDSPWDPAKNKFVVVFVPDAATRDHLINETPVIVTDETSTKVRVDNVFDADPARAKPTEIVYGQAPFVSQGFNQVMSDPGAKAEMVDARGVRFDCVVLEEINRQNVKFRTAELLESGDYKFMLTSRGGDAEGDPQTVMKKVKYVRVAPPDDHAVLTGLSTSDEDAPGELSLADGIKLAFDRIDPEGRTGHLVVNGVEQPAPVEVTQADPWVMWTFGRDELIGQEVTFKFRYEDGTETGNVTKTIRAQR